MVLDENERAAITKSTSDGFKMRMAIVCWMVWMMSYWFVVTVPCEGDYEKRCLAAKIVVTFGSGTEWEMISEC